MHRVAGFILSILFPLAVLAQEKITIRGKLLDRQGAPVPSASLHLLNTNYFTQSDISGEFSFTVETGSYLLEITAIGYAATTDSFVADQNQPEQIYHLSPAVSQLDQVVITAGKKEEILQTTPVSVSSLSAAAVRNLRLWNSRELTAVVPNLYSANPGDNRNVSSIRGITTTSYEPAIATYIDGVNQFGLDTYIAELIDIERIEVLRGPQGTLYGRNAMGGVINIITKNPSPKLRGQTEVSIGNYGQRRMGAGISGPVAKKISAGAYILRNSSKGFYTNDFNESDYDAYSAFAGNYFLRYRPAETWNISLNLKHYSNKNKGPFPLVFGVAEAFSNPFRLNQNAITTMHDRILNGSFSVNHYGKKINLAAQTAYQSNHRFYSDPIDGDFSPLDGLVIINNYGRDWNKVKVFTQELRVSRATSKVSPFDYTLGAYGFLSDNPVKQTSYYGVDAGMLGAPDANFSTINTIKAKGKGLALFGHASYAVDARFEVFGGLRFDYEYRWQKVLSQYQKDPDPIPVFDIIPDTSANMNFTAFSPKLGIRYLLPAATIYAVYSQGFRAGGFTQIGQDPSSPPLYSFKPEYSRNYELGMKNSFLNNRLRANISIFYIELDEVQIPSLILPEALVITRNAGALKSRGFEMEMAASPAKGLTIDYNFGYTNAAYSRLLIPVDGDLIDLKGKKQIFTPDISSFAAIQYAADILPELKLTLSGRLEWIYLGERYFDLLNTIRQAPNHLVNAKLGFSIGDAEIMFWARNLTDSRYIAYAYDFGAVHLANPSNFGITLSSRF